MIKQFTIELTAPSTQEQTVNMSKSKDQSTTLFGSLKSFVLKSK